MIVTTFSLSQSNGTEGLDITLDIKKMEDCTYI